MKSATIDTSPLSVFRFLGVVTVVLIHYGKNIETFYLFPNIFSKEQSVILGGATITFFYVLSGFGLFLSYHKQGTINLRQYFIKRVIRILPFYYLALLMMALILFIANRFSFTQFLLSLLCIQSWFPGYQHSINPPGWFVSNLLFFYCIFPLIFFLITKKNPDARKLLFSSILLWVATLIVLNTQLSRYPESYFVYIYCFPLSHFASFYMGICGAYFIKSNETKDHWVSNNSVSYTLIFLLLFSLILTIHYQLDVRGFLETKLPFETTASLYSPIVLLIIINLSTARNYVIQIFSWRIFGLLGTISYPLYIFQAPIHTLYSHFISKPMKMQPGADFVFFFLLIMVFAGVLTIFENITFKKIYLKVSYKQSLNSP